MLLANSKYTLIFNLFQDSLDLFYVMLIVVIGLLIILSTLHDFHLKRHNLPHLCNREHYKRPVNDSGCK